MLFHPAECLSHSAGRYLSIDAFAEKTAVDDEESADEGSRSGSGADAAAGADILGRVPDPADGEEGRPGDGRANGRGEVCSERQDPRARGQHRSAHATSTGWR